MQDLNDMLYFAEVAERGGFAAAGRALGVPKSRLSRRIAELEARLGVRLLQRTTRKLSLTSVGETYLRHCAAMRDEALAASEAVALVQAVPRGPLRISCPVTLAQTSVGYLIPRYMTAHPQVTLDVMVTNRVVDLVEEGVDVALRVRPTLDDSGSLVIKLLGEGRGQLLASPALLQRQGTPQSLADLQRMDMVAMSAVGGFSEWTLTGPDGVAQVIKRQARLVADDLQTLKLAMLAGAGLGFLPPLISQAERQAQLLVPVLPGWSLPTSQVHAVFTSRRGQVPAVRSFLDFLGANLRGEHLTVAA